MLVINPADFNQTYTVIVQGSQSSREKDFGNYTVGIYCGYNAFKTTNRPTAATVSPTADPTADPVFKMDISSTAAIFYYKN